jgi:acetyl-CoA/propionyl-CoA carboxylase biotin carboxyl carrier protein
MPGRIISVKVSVGDTVARGDTVAVIEAMKMESMIIAPHSGKVVAVHVTPDTVVATRQALLRIDG